MNNKYYASVNWELNDNFQLNDINLSWDFPAGSILSVTIMLCDLRYNVKMTINTIGEKQSILNEIQLFINDEYRIHQNKYPDKKIGIKVYFNNPSYSIDLENEQIEENGTNYCKKITVRKSGLHFDELICSTIFNTNLF